MADNLYKLPTPGVAYPNAPRGNLSRDRRPIGVFGEHPGYTPKYARNEGQREDDFRESMARLFIQVADQAAYDRFVNSVPDESKDLARVLAGTNAGVGGLGYMDFLLQRAPLSFQEKLAVVETLADNFVIYAFGQAAPQVTYSGVLINTRQDDQAVSMYRIYRDMIRASQLARRKQVVRLRYDSYIVSGVTNGLQMDLAAENETYCPFSMPMILTSVLVLPNEWSSLNVLSEAFDVTGTLPKPAEVITPAGPVRHLLAPPVEPVTKETSQAPSEQFGVEDVDEVKTMQETANGPSFYDKLARIRPGRE